jgi:hypothetical protein
MDPDSGDAGDSEYPRPRLDAETVGDVVARDRRMSGAALRIDATGRTYSYRDFVTTSYQAGNVLRHLGVREGERVLIVPAALPEPILAFFGAAQLGAVTRFGEQIGDKDDAPRVVVVPSDREGEFDLPPGHHLLVYGEPPTDPATTHWGTEVWSENPAIHPASVGGSDPLLDAGSRTYSHAEALSEAASVVENAALAPGEETTLHGSLADPAAVISGVLAPIAAGSTAVVAAGRDERPIDLEDASSGTDSEIG